jgi:hypothetical protein
MARISIDQATGNLLMAGKPVFPIVLSDPPPLGAVAPTRGLDAWAEIASVGVRLVRNYTVWTAAAVEEQLIALAKELDAAPHHGLQLWVGLAVVDEDLSRQSLLDEIVGEIRGHPGLGPWKGVDEPALGHVRAAGCVAVYEHLKAVDPNHPLVIVEAPRGRARRRGGQPCRLPPRPFDLTRPPGDIHGVDIYPIPPGAHAGGPPVNTDLSVVGDMTTIIARATARRAIWTTLQIAWSGVFPPHPVLFPTLQQARFMAYDAIVSGARGWRSSAASSSRSWTPPIERSAGTGPTGGGPAATSRRVDRRPAYGRAHRAPLHVHDRGERLGRRTELTRSRRSPLSDRDPEDPHGDRHRALLGPSGRHRRRDRVPHPGGNPVRPVTVKGGAFTDPTPFAPHNARAYSFQLAT